MSTTEQRLARLLDSPNLARVVPHLPAETLHQLIRYRGLDACGELVTSATPAQLTSVLDIDLWRQAWPGRDEELDVGRFGEWLEVLVDSGESIAARTVAALDKELVIAGLSRYVRVFDPGTFEPTEASDDEPIDRHEKMNSETSANVVEDEVGGYLLRARRTDAWDAIVALLLALETEHVQYFHAVMEGCRRLSNSRPEVDGLDDLLMAPEQHLHDVASDRERRRSRHGYATAADARAFLQMARQRDQPAGNPIATAYFRAAADAEPAPDPAGVPVRPADDGRASIEGIVELLTEAGVMPARPRALLGGAANDPRAATLPHLRSWMESLLQRDEVAYLARTSELAFLANTLLAGGSVQSRAFTPQEASDAAACVCNLGLERGAPDDLVIAFQRGWSMLHEEVSLFVADRLISTLAGLHPIDDDLRRELRTLERQLVKHRAAGTPWLARDAADVLATLDATAGVSLLGLLDECPVMPAALTAVLERRTTSVSQTAFEFISSSAQIGDIRVFMSALPGLLSS